MSQTKTVEPEPIIDPLEKIKKEISKDYGVKLTTGFDLVSKKQEVIPISPALDLITGGIISGSFITLSGPPKAGKSLTSLSIASNCQKSEYGNRWVYYLNVEARLRSRDLLGIKGLDPKRFTIIESQKGNLLTGEKYLAIAEHLIKSHPGCVIILDSAGAICTNAELTAGMDEMQRADGPKLLAKFCRKISNLLPVQDVIFICILQLQANPSGYGASMVEKSGNAIRYITDTKLKIKKFSFVKNSDKPVGQELTWICECSPLCGPGNEITGFIRYGIGLDKMYEVMNIGLDCGILVQKGAWITSPFLDKLSEDKKEFIIQGKEKMYQFLLKNSEAYMLLETKIKEILM